MGKVQPNEPTNTDMLRHFVMTSARDKEMIDEFVKITAEYEELARQLEALNIPQRRADIILTLINSGTHRRTYAEVGQMLGGLSPARVGQILKAARRRMLIQARAERQECEEKNAA